MMEIQLSTQAPKQTPREGEITIAYVIYGLHAFSAISGVLSPMLVITTFLTGWPSIIAVILTYIKRDAVQDTYLASHFRWTLRTFWFAIVWVLIGGLVSITIIGLPIAIMIWVGSGLWILYRIIRGLLRLLSEEAMPV